MTDDDYDDGFDPTSRLDDPWTSKDAGLSVTPAMKSEMYQLILDALRLYGPGTMYDIALWSGLRVDQVHKRCPELLWNPEHRNRAFVASRGHRYGSSQSPMPDLASDNRR